MFTRVSDFLVQLNVHKFLRQTVRSWTVTAINSAGLARLPICRFALYRPWLRKKEYWNVGNTGREFVKKKKNEQRNQWVQALRPSNRSFLGRYAATAMFVLCLCVHVTARRCPLCDDSSGFLNHVCSSSKSVHGRKSLPPVFRQLRSLHWRSAREEVAHLSRKV